MNAYRIPGTFMSLVTQVFKLHKISSLSVPPLPHHWNLQPGFSPFYPTHEFQNHHHNILLIMTLSGLRTYHGFSRPKNKLPPFWKGTGGYLNQALGFASQKSWLLFLLFFHLSCDLDFPEQWDEHNTKIKSMGFGGRSLSLPPNVNTIVTLGKLFYLSDFVCNMA